MLLTMDTSEVKNTTSQNSSGFDTAGAMPAVALLEMQEKPRCIEAYLLCPILSKREKRGDYKHFFDKSLNNIGQRLSGQQIFLSQQAALQHNRFMGNECAVLKVHLPETAIEGCNHGLTLKKDLLEKSFVHSCFLKTMRGFVQYKNPYFDQRYLPKGASS